MVAIWAECPNLLTASVTRMGYINTRVHWMKDQRLNTEPRLLLQVGQRIKNITTKKF